MRKYKLSVIIPTLNEELYIKRCIDSVKLLNPIEIIVVDGGSNDRTVEIARLGGALVIKSEKGRGVQLQKGALAAKGDILLFIHADAVIKQKVNFDKIIEAGFGGGFFKLEFDVDSLPIRLVERFANFRSSFHSLPYGDQAIFVRKDIFLQTGGFKAYPFLEDIDFVIRLRKKARLFCLPYYVTVSSRRLIKPIPLSPILVSIRNVMIVLLLFLGVSPNKLVKFYK